MTDAISPAPSAATVPNGSGKRRGGGNLSQMFCHGLKLWVDPDLFAAINLASNVEHERSAIILRRWLRRSAISEGYLKFPKPAAD
jgi:hypothetical protein